MAWMPGLLNPPNNLLASKDVSPALYDSAKEDKQSPASRSPSPKIDDLVANMNKIAGKQTAAGSWRAPYAVIASQQEVSGGYQELGTRRSPRKHPPPELSSEKSRLYKMARVSEFESVGRGLQRASQGRQPRVIVRSQRIYDMEDDDLEEPLANEPHNLLDRNEKQRNLQKAWPKSSPLKNQGTIHIPETNRVNLEDSPSKKPAGRSRAIFTVSITRPETRSLGSESIVNNPNRADDCPQEQVTATEEAAADPTDGESASLGESDHEAIDIDRAQSQSPRPRKQRRKRGADNPERSAQELEGLELVTDLHGGHSAWGSLFVGSAILQESKGHLNPESSKGIEIDRNIKLLRLRLRKEMENTIDDSTPAPHTITDDIIGIGTALLDLQRRRAANDMEIGKRVRDLYEHIVPGLCKTLKLLLKRRQIEGDLAIECYEEVFAVLDTAYQAADLACSWKPRPSTLAKGACESMRVNVRPNLCLLRKIFKSLIGLQQQRASEIDRNDRFYELQKLDPLHDRIRRYTQSVNNNSKRSAPEVTDTALSQRESVDDDGIVAGDIPSPKTITEQARNHRFYIDFQKRDWETFMDDIRQRRAAKGIGCPKLISGHKTPSYQQDQVIDVDDIDLQERFQVSTHPTSLPTRPRPVRAQTEEIPGPIQPDWTKTERIVLQNALQKYLSPARFEHILDVYGGEGGYLERHDLDSLMTQAKSIKQHMANFLAQGGSELDWLRSVPS